MRIIVAIRIAIAAREQFPFEMVLMLGDNIYGGQTPKDFVQKFELPYRPLLEAGVRFYASLGNQDNQSNRLYKPFNMGDERDYTFSKRNVRCFVLDSDYLNEKQRRGSRARATSGRSVISITRSTRTAAVMGHRSICACSSSRSSSGTALTSCFPAVLHKEPRP